MANQTISRRIVFGSIICAGLGLNSNRAMAQNIGEILNAISVTKTPKTSILGAGLSNVEIDNGLREALSNGAIAAILRTGKLDGFWADNLIRIPLPSTLGKLQKSLKPLGLSKPFDDLQLKMNRAAENSVPLAKDIFMGAIRNFTIPDVVGVLNGGPNAGTMLLKDKTKPLLMDAFRPQMQNAIDTSGAGLTLSKIDKKYGSQIGALGNLGGTNTSAKKQDLKSQLVDYAVSKSLDGLFYYIANEESEIRKNPAKRTSDLLKKVFSAVK